MAFSRKKKIAAAVAALLALLLVGPWLVPARAYRARIEASLGRALGRTVTLDDVSVHLLPRPGLSLSNLVIGEDPAFGPEPMLYAPEVTADVRLGSLLRGRLEFSTLSAKDASFNLVRRDDGVWSFRSPMERTRNSSVVSAAHQPAPQLPYLEATNSRVNFKYGLEKKPFALVDADFALWVDTDRWHARLRARPIRSDANLSDMGTLQAEGTLLARNESPAAVTVQARWDEAQLGQGSALFFGRDRGWRGGISGELNAGGDLEALQFKTTLAVSGFHRYDIMPTEALRLGASCSGKFLPVEGALSNLKCNASAGDGTIAVTGDTSNLWAKRRYNLKARLEAVPVERLVAFARNAKKDLPSDLTAAGNFSGEFSLSTDAAGVPRLAGGGTASKLTLRSDASGATLPLDSISFVIKPAAAAKTKSREPDSYQLIAAPFPVPLGGARPAEAAATFDRRGYGIKLHGSAGLTRLQTVARLLGMRPPAYSLAGTAELQLQIAGEWAEFAPPLVTGEAQLNDVITDALGTEAALRLSSAHLLLRSDAAVLENFSAALGASGPRFTGAVWLPRHCAHPEDCEVKFNLRAASLSLDELNQALHPAPVQRAWYQFGSGTPARPSLARVHATGQLSCSRVSFHSLKASDASASLILDAGQVRIANIQAKLLGGRYRGSWSADFTGALPQYGGSGTLDAIAMAQVAELMGDKWAEGTAGGEFQLNFSGRTRVEMLASATGDAAFLWRNGTLRHVALPEKSAQPGLRFTQFRGHLSLQKQRVLFTGSRISAAAGTYEISGSASLERALALTLTRGKGNAYAVSGTLEAPKVSESQASLTAAHGEPSTATR